MDKLKVKPVSQQLREMGYIMLPSRVRPADVGVVALQQGFSMSRAAAMAEEARFKTNKADSEVK